MSSAKNRRSYGQHGDLRALRNLFQEAMPRMFIKLAIGVVYCLKPSHRTKNLDKKNYDAFINPKLRHPKVTSVVPSMELLYDNKCASKPKGCCRKLVNPSMVDTPLFWKDGTKMTNTARICQIGWAEEQIISMINWHWKITAIQKQDKKEIVTRKVGYSS